MKRILFSQIRMILLKYESERHAAARSTYLLGSAWRPCSLVESLHGELCPFLHERAKIFRYISAQINIYIHSVRGRHLRTTGKFGGAAVFKVRTMWTEGILNLNKI